MKSHLAWIIALVPLHAGADIYKSFDSSGQVMYSDTPTRGAEKIPEQLTPTQLPPSSPEAGNTAPATATTGTGYYTVFQIRNPTSGETVRDAGGALNIDIDVVPSLDFQEGHILIVTVDGKSITSHDNGTQLTLSNLAPGPHILKAQIMDGTGQTLVGTKSLTFYMRRAPGTAGAIEPPAHPLSPSQPTH